MSNVLRVEGYDGVVEAARSAARDAGVSIIARIQDRQAQSATVNNGEVESVSSSRTLGLGVQAFVPSGHTGFASTDLVGPVAARETVLEAATLARAAAAFGTEPNPAVFDVKSNGHARLLAGGRPLDALSLERALALLTERNRSAAGEGRSVRSSYSVVDECWRIVRSDGTDVSFDMPRAFVVQAVTAKRDGATASVGAAVSGMDSRVLTDEDCSRRLEQRTQRAASLAGALCGAPRIRSGHYRLIVDYALAKGLAHEAFGHAAETDGMESSILGREGRMQVGESVAASHVSILDGPIHGDYAYQPVSATGIPRETVTILDHGVLRAGLGDIFSAGKAGVRITGADRVESFRNLPIPRMTNIRIEVDNPVAFETPFEQVSPEQVQQLARDLGLLSDRVPTLFLSGYKGGQVNPKEGDFVFNCSAIYDLTDSGRLYLPAIFSGKVLSALRAILTGIGPLYLDAMGHCGKAGQSVPSSGGSHAFLVIDASPDVTIGGAG